MCWFWSTNCCLKYYMPLQLIFKTEGDIWLYRFHEHWKYYNVPNILLLQASLAVPSWRWRRRVWVTSLMPSWKAKGNEHPFSDFLVFDLGIMRNYNLSMITLFHITYLCNWITRSIHLKNALWRHFSFCTWNGSHKWYFSYLRLDCLWCFTLPAPVLTYITPFSTS